MKEKEYLLKKKRELLERIKSDRECSKEEDHVYIDKELSYSERKKTKSFLSGPSWLDSSTWVEINYDSVCEICVCCGKTRVLAKNITGKYPI